MRFWDSSALVPIVLKQPRTEEARAWLDEDPGIVAWTLTRVEVLSAVHRMVREGGLAMANRAKAEEEVALLLAPAQLVTDIEGTKERAARLLRVHALCAADALQLAAALAWSLDRPAGHILHTFDTRLGGAAEREGFRVIPDVV